MRIHAFLIIFIIQALWAFGQPPKAQYSFGINPGFGYQNEMLLIKEAKPIYFNGYYPGINSLDTWYFDPAIFVRRNQVELGFSPRVGLAWLPATFEKPRQNTVQVFPHVWLAQYFGGKNKGLLRAGLTATLMRYTTDLVAEPNANPSDKPQIDDHINYFAFGPLLGIRLFKKGFLSDTYFNINVQFSPPATFDYQVIDSPSWLWNSNVGLNKAIVFHKHQ